MEEAEPAKEDIPSGLQSPTKTGHPLDRMNELTANSREREESAWISRITNSSLAAINRTLEREMRKQAAELAAIADYLALAVSQSRPPLPSAPQMVSAASAMKMARSSPT